MQGGCIADIGSLEQDLILQAVRYERRNFEQKDWNSLIGKERKQSDAKSFINLS
jgi:hypothetical protein